MKRLFSLIFTLCLFLPGCSAGAERIKEPVTFYYVYENYQKDMGQVIASEIREASGHKEDLSYLLALYSMGPSSEDLELPLPRSTKIILTEQTDNCLTLNLSENSLTITDADFTLASTCIAMTCMELTGVPQVTVICGERNISVQEDNLLLYNTTTQIQQEETK